MRIHCLRLHNFMRFGETANVVEFDRGAGEFLQALDNPVLWQREELRRQAAEALVAWRQGAHRMLSIVGEVDGNVSESNAAGKSSILEGISYAFYEKVVREFVRPDRDRDSGKKSTLSVMRQTLEGNNGTLERRFFSPSYVDVLFSENDELWLLRRGRKLGSHDKHKPIRELLCLSSREFAQEGSRRGHRADDDDDTIRRLVKMSFETFSNSIMFGQADAGQFLAGTDKSRKEILVNLLQLGVLVEYLEETRMRKRQWETDLGSAEAQRTLLEEQSRQEPADLPARVRVAEQQVQACEKALADLRPRLQKAQAAPALAGEERARRDLDSERQLLESKQKELGISLEAMQREQDGLRQKQAENGQQLARRQQEMEKQEESQVLLQKRLAEFDEARVRQTSVWIEAAKQALPQRKQQLDEALGEEKRLHGEVVALSHDGSRLDGERQELETLRASCQRGQQVRCSKCRSQVGRDHVESELRRLQAELDGLGIKRAGKEKLLQTCQEQIKAVRSKLDRIDRCLRQESSLATTVARHESDCRERDAGLQRKKDLGDELGLLEKNRQTIGKEVERAEAALQTAREKQEAQLKPLRDRCERARKQAENCLQEAQQARALVGVLEAERDRHGQAKEEALSVLGGLREQWKQREKIIQSLRQLEQRQKEQRTQIDRLKLLEELFGSDGMQARLVEQYLPVLNAHLEEYGAIVSRGRLHVRLAMDGKRDGQIDLEIWGDSADATTMLSGGEGVKLRLAVSIALGMLSFARGRGMPEFICLDEILAPVDVATKEAVFDLLERLRERFPLVLVISHDPVLQERIKDTIVVEKRDGISAVKRQFYAAAAVEESPAS